MCSVQHRRCHVNLRSAKTDSGPTNCTVRKLNRVERNDVHSVILGQCLEGLAEVSDLRSKPVVESLHKRVVGYLT